MGNKLLDLILRSVVPCRHKNQSWPMRLPDEDGPHRTCLECGRRRRYNLLDPVRGALPERSVANHPSRAAVPLLRCLRPVRPMGNQDDRDEPGKALAA